jgi:hypothetical protein
MGGGCLKFIYTSFVGIQVKTLGTNPIWAVLELHEEKGRAHEYQVLLLTCFVSLSQLLRGYRETPF